jgi:ketosteroid isomerase-like protein
MKVALSTTAASLVLATMCWAADAPKNPDSIMSSIQAFTNEVNRGDTPAAVAHFTANPSITEDGAPFHWTGAGAGEAWIASMNATADANRMTAIDMQLSPATRVEVAGGRAYVIVPGVLTYEMKDGHRKISAGQLTFALQRVGADWKIETLTWTGPRVN